MDEIGHIPYFFNKQQFIDFYKNNIKNKIFNSDDIDYIIKNFFDFTQNIKLQYLFFDTALEILADFILNTQLSTKQVSKILKQILDTKQIPLRYLFIEALVEKQPRITKNQKELIIQLQYHEFLNKEDGFTILLDTQYSCEALLYFLQVNNIPIQQHHITQILNKKNKIEDVCIIIMNMEKLNIEPDYNTFKQILHLQLLLPKIKLNSQKYSYQEKYFSKIQLYLAEYIFKYVSKLKEFDDELSQLLFSINLLPINMNILIIQQMINSNFIPKINENILFNLCTYQYELNTDYDPIDYTTITPDQIFDGIGYYLNEIVKVEKNIKYGDVNPLINTFFHIDNKIYYNFIKYILNLFDFEISDCLIRYVVKEHDAIMLHLLIQERNILIKSDHIRSIVRNNQLERFNKIMNYKIILNESLASECTTSSMLQSLVLNGMPMNLKTLEYIIANKTYNFDSNDDILNDLTDYGIQYDDDLYQILNKYDIYPRKFMNKILENEKLKKLINYRQSFTNRDLIIVNDILYKPDLCCLNFAIRAENKHIILQLINKYKLIPDPIVISQTKNYFLHLYIDNIQSK